MRERENLFNDYMDELRRKEKDEKHQKKEQVSPKHLMLLKWMHEWSFTIELSDKAFYKWIRVKFYAVTITKHLTLCFLLLRDNFLSFNFITIHCCYLFIFWWKQMYVVQITNRKRLRVSDHTKSLSSKNVSSINITRVGLKARQRRSWIRCRG